MTLDVRRLREQIHELYRSEHEALGEQGTPPSVGNRYASSKNL
jgi:hypothetical protein